MNQQPESIIGNNYSFGWRLAPVLERSRSWIGTADGLAAAANRSGIRISGSNNSLGTNGNPASGNLISGNTRLGLEVFSGSGNSLYYNWIGLQKDGTSALRNSGGGIKIYRGGQLMFKPGNKIKA